jgi:hypothetical protein
MSLESPEADKHLNSGTSAPNCQPKHTKEAQDIQERNSLDSHDEDDGHLKHQRGSSTSTSDSDDERRKRQHTNPSAKEQQRKMSYFQMARMGYQELVNAIIRPPRADYKVSR